MKCKWYLCNNEAKLKGVFCSNKCKTTAAVTRKRRELKKQAVEYKGGKCGKCGYSKSITALHFHHLDPNEKDFAISRKGTTRSWEKIRVELDKCELICANCHAETHEQEYNLKVGNSLEVTSEKNKITLPKKQVEKMVSETNFSDVGRKLGVSGNTVKRFILR